MASTEAQKRATIKYAKAHLKRVPFDLPKDYFENVLKPAADRAGESVNGYIKAAIQARIDKESRD